MNNIMRASKLLILTFLYISVWTGSISQANTTENKASQDARYVIAATPQWVERSEINYNNGLNKTQPSQYLLVEQQIRLLKTPINYSRYVSKALTMEGVDASSEIRITFNPAFQELQIHNIKVIRGDEVRSIENEVKIRILDQENELDNSIQMGLNQALITIDDVRKGDVVDYDFSIIGRNPIFAGKGFGYVAMNWQVAVDKVSIRIINERDQILNVKMHNSDLKPSITKSGSVTEYKLEFTHSESVVDEGEYPSSYNPYSWLEYSEFSSWNEVEDWAFSVYPITQKGNEDILKIINGIRKEHKNKEDQVLAIISFVQNDIRYEGLEFGENSHKPYPPLEVIDKRLGDCKDKALLLKVLLREIGVDSYPALVSTTTREYLVNGLANPSAFDHVISMVSFQGKDFWVDGTRTYQEGVLSNRGISDYGYALKIGTGEGRLTDMYQSPPETYRINVEEDIYTNNFDSDAILKVKTTYYRNAAEHQRYKFVNFDKEKINRKLEEFYGNYYNKIEMIGDAQYSENKKGNVVVIEEEYKIHDFIKKSDSKVQHRMEIPSFTGYLNKPKVVNRTSPFFLGYSHEISHISRIHYSEDVDLSFGDEMKKFKNDAFEFEYLDSYEDNVYTFYSKLNTSAAPLKAIDIEEYIKDYGLINKTLSYTISFNDPSSGVGFREIFSLKRRLKDLSK